MTSAQSASATGPALKVLIVDDEPADREIFKQYLDADRPGLFAWADAGTGMDGLRKMEVFKPDCVLLDFNLPDLDGLNMIRLLLDGRDQLPCAVVMLTATGNEEIAVEAMKLGVMDYLAKGPASLQALPRTVTSAVQRFNLEQEIARNRLQLEQRNRELEATRNELFEEKERYRNLAEAIPQLVWMADSSGCIHYGNQRLWEFNGKPSGNLWLVESLVHPDDRSEMRDKWCEAQKSGIAFESELRLLRAQDSTWRWHLMRTAPIRTAEGGTFRWFGTFTDIEDQRRGEEALRQREKLDSIGVLAGGIAHDFNNLLVGIMGGASFALETLESNHAAYPMLEMILRSSERAADLTQQLLAYAGKVQILLEQADISRIAREACEQVRPAIPRNIHLAVKTAGDIPLIETHVGNMRQVVVNLVMNAVEAIGEAAGVVTVRTALETVMQGKHQSNVLGYKVPAGRYVLVEVADSGPGMNDQVQTQIFDPFFTTKFTGRGLGLAVVQGIVRSLAGAICVSSAAGRGSTFQVLLPLRESVDSATGREGALNGLELDGPTA